MEAVKAEEPDLDSESEEETDDETDENGDVSEEEQAEEEDKLDKHSQLRPDEQQAPEDVPRGRRSTSLEDGDAELSDPVSSRPLSRSPPRSRSLSPVSLEKMAAAMSLQSGVKDLVSSDLAKTRARQQRKHHSKRGVRQAGRPQGSKAKQDTRVKLDRGGFWD